MKLHGEEAKESEKKSYTYIEYKKNLFSRTHLTIKWSDNKKRDCNYIKGDGMQYRLYPPSCMVLSSLTDGTSLAMLNS